VPAEAPLEDGATAAPASAAEVDVSIIVPTHDRRALLERKLTALEGEEEGFEVVVVADACSDDTEAFLAAYAPPYPLRWTTSPGTHAAGARNRGVALSRGRILLFSDDDVVPRPGWVAANRRAHRAPRVVALSAHVLPPHLSEGAALRGPVFWWNTNGASMSVAAGFFRAVGGYDDTFTAYGGEDPDLGFRLWRAGARFVYLREPPVEHWDEGYARDLEAKARSAGRAHVRVWRKYGDDRIAWALGVHPLMARLKRLVLNDVVARRWDSPRLRYERAYLEGALEAQREGASP
jgi:GT2 family glycosyltransferase